MTTPDLTPTPPADTRQQAAEPKRVWHAREQNEVVDLLVEAVPGVHLALSARYPMARAVLEAYGAAPSALASSSPALPEPPAPSSTDDTGAIWRPLPDFSGGVVDGDNQSGEVMIGGFGRQNLTPAEARLLASTLLAAADVAEEQQP